MIETIRTTPRLTPMPMPVLAPIESPGDKSMATRVEFGEDDVSLSQLLLMSVC